MERPIDTGIRQNGNTTRLVDFYIQELFHKEIISIFDHHNNTDFEIKGNKYLFDRIVYRLNNEHHNLLSKLNINKNKLTISWKL